MQVICADYIYLKVAMVGVPIIFPLIHQSGCSTSRQILDDVLVKQQIQPSISPHYSC